MTPEQASRLFPYLIGTLGACITAGALIAREYQLAAAGAVLLVLVVVATAFVRIQQEVERKDTPPDDRV